jgi:biofilm protein TabA
LNHGGHRVLRGVEEEGLDFYNHPAVRKIAPVPANSDGIVRCMIHENESACYVYVYRKKNDGPADGDYWFESLEEAEEFTRERFGIVDPAWSTISEPLPDCQHDWIAPVRINGSSEGKPEWGQFEVLQEDGIWVPLVRRV